MIKLIVLDVDGCLTDGGIIYSNTLEEIKVFNVKDGLSIVSWHKLGKKSAIITGRTSSIVEHRAKELGINFLYQGVSDKLVCLESLLKKENISWDEIAVVGDDLNDINVLKKAFFSFCPADASAYAKSVSKYILNSNGGKAAIREMIEIIVKNENLEEEYLSLWC